MKYRQLVWVFTLGGVIVFTVGFALAVIISPYLNGDQIVYVLGGAAFLLIAVGYMFNYFVQGYMFGTRRLTEETKVIIGANPAHRVKIDDPADVKELGDTINTFADRFQAVLQDRAAQIEQAKAALEDEKNRLAALMSELSEGVIVSNVEGQILLYNARARQLLGRSSLGEQWVDKAGGFIGLGRSIFGLLDRHTITHAAEELEYRKGKKSASLVSQFVTTAINGQIIRTRVTPILDQEQKTSGYVFTLEDVSQQSQSSRRRDMLLQALTEGVRSSLANIRTAIETIEQYPQMDSEKLNQLRHVISDESLTLSTRLNQITSEHDTYLKADWQLESMLAGDLLWAIQRRFEDKLEVSTTVEEFDENLWLKVDSYSVVQALSYVMQRLKADFGIYTVQIRLKQTGQFAVLDLVWHNVEIDMDTLWSWQNQTLTGIENGDNTVLTLREVAEHHGGEVWAQTDKETNTAYFRLMLTATNPKLARTSFTVQASRPEYYDFDLFNQPGQTPELDNRPLSELTYTVFDTETTGLNPSAGDEIISIGAVRVVNGRLLRQEVFDQLVDPQRPLSAKSTEIHGISSDMLKGQPTIEQVLPLLYRFSEGTVLVAHNAAFDMRMLQVKEAKTGVKFTNPVLDTLLLSAVTHANHKDHSLEAIAQRLGVDVFGRHTSLGDAILTGEVFLKLLPLLADRGIHTLQDAREAAEKTYMARIKY